MNDVKLAGFDLIEKVGEGGMGQVWKARQLSLDRLVAIKLLPPKLSHDPQSIQQIIKEARTAAKLKHPGIVHVYDASERDGHCCLVMEFVDGYNVGQWISRKKTLSYKDALVVVEAVAVALKYAWHEAGLIHCDIKPENIMVDHDGSIKVADLGLSLTRDTQAAAQASDEIAGTPGYISPEQVQGDVPLDCRTDIYALGCCLYHMVTGVRPFRDLPDSAAMEAQLSSQIPDPRDIVPEIPASVCVLIEWMLIKDRNHRLADWDAVLKELHRVQKSSMSARGLPPAGASTMLRRVLPSTIVPEAVKVAEKSRVARVAPVLVVIAVVLGGMWWFFKHRLPVVSAPIQNLTIAIVTNKPVQTAPRAPVVAAPVNHDREIAQATRTIKKKADDFVAEGKLSEGIEWLENYSEGWAKETDGIRKELAGSLKAKQAAISEAVQAEGAWTNCLAEVTSCVLSGKYAVASQLVSSVLKEGKQKKHQPELESMDRILLDVCALPDKILKTYEPDIGRNVVIQLVRGTLMGKLVAIQDRKLVVKTMDDVAQVNLRLEEIAPAERQARMISLNLPEGNLVRGVAAYNTGENDDDAEDLLSKTDSVLGPLLIQYKKASGASAGDKPSERTPGDEATRNDPAFIAFAKLAKKIGINLKRRDFSDMKNTIDTANISPESAAQADRAMDMYLEAYGASAFAESNADLILTFQSACGRALHPKPASPPTSVAPRSRETGRNSEGREE